MSTAPPSYSSGNAPAKPVQPLCAVRLRAGLIAFDDAVFLFYCGFDAFPEVIFRLLIGK